jgi:glycosyltransferase involved in cell wall biosynthesis
MGHTNRSPKTVVVVAPIGAGHRPTYVRHLLDGAPADTRVVVATTPAALASPGFKTQSALSTKWAEAHVVAWDDWSLDGLTRLGDSCDAAHAVLIDGDRTLLRIGFRGKWAGPRLTALVMRDQAQYRRAPLATASATRIRNVLFRRAAKTEGVRPVWLRPPYSTRRERQQVVIDPIELHARVEDRDELRSELRLTSGIAWVALLGAINERKNPGLLVDAAILRPETGLLVVGTTTPSVDAELARARSAGVQVVAHPGYRTDVEIDRAVVAADAVVAIHSNTGASGVVAKALAVGTPVVVGGSRDLREVVEAAPTLGTWSESAPSAVAAALQRAVSMERVPALDAKQASPIAFARALLSGPE